MKFIPLMALLWRNRTRTFAVVQGLVGVLAGATGVFDEQSLKYLLLANALLTYMLGQFNSWEAKQTPPPPPPTEQP